MFSKESIQELAKAQAITAADSALDGATKGDALVALPDDFKVIDLEKYLLRRRRARGTMTTSIVADFAAYVTSHREPGASVFVDSAAMTADGVLNLGDPDFPGHADNLARFVAKKTAPYDALLKATGVVLAQRAAAEFVEDWAPFIQCLNGTEEITTPKAIAALRAITIEGMRRMESTEQSLSASKSAFEKVEAKSTDPLPTFVMFKCVPFQDLRERTFVARLGIQTGSDKPAIQLRITNAEKHAEEMAAELAQLVRASLNGELPVLVGTYRPS